ncbi:MAG: formate dehydrogenase accessory protein FdhE [Firmicutes bacterium]|nr:formate dehydrogenase accessory protein FdhE [Bacillota bacterium]
MSSRSLEQVTSEINECARRYPEFAQVKKLIEVLFQKQDSLLDKVKVNSEDLKIELLELENKLQNGVPLFASTVVDKELLIKFAEDACEALIETTPQLTENFHMFLEKLKQSIMQKDEVRISDVFSLMQEMEQSKQLERDLTTFFLTFVFSGVIATSLKDTIESIDTKLWEKGICPICGEKPHYGYLKGEGGSRTFDCWLCGCQWGSPRLKCPFCDNVAIDDMGYFTVEDNANCRIYFCKKCNAYHKTFDVREFVQDDVILAIHNLATLSYDLLAQREGFKPGSGLQWVNEEEHRKSAN